MRTTAIVGIVATGLLGACATTPEQIECFQPNRRVLVEVAGMKPKPVPPPKPGEPAAKPGTVASELSALLQGNSAFDFRSAVIKDEGKAELDKLV